MFKFQMIAGGFGGWSGYLFKEKENKEICVGGLNIQQDNEVHINIYKGQELTVKELMLLISQLMQNNDNLIDKKIFINQIEN